MELNDFGIDEEVEAGVDENKEYDPFDGAEGTRTATLITLMRIYDVLLAQYAEVNDDKASALINAHASGRVLASLPQLQL